MFDFSRDFDFFDRLYQDIYAYFKEHPELGKIKVLAAGQSPEHHGMVHVTCTYQRHYVVCQEEGELLVEPYIHMPISGAYSVF